MSTTHIPYLHFATIRVPALSPALTLSLRVLSTLMFDTTLSGSMLPVVRFLFTGFQRLIWLLISSRNLCPPFSSIVTVVVLDCSLLEHFVSFFILFYSLHLFLFFFSFLSFLFNNTCPAGGVLDLLGHVLGLSGHLFINYMYHYASFTSHDLTVYLYTFFLSFLPFLSCHSPDTEV